MIWRSAESRIAPSGLRLALVIVAILGLSAAESPRIKVTASPPLQLESRDSKVTVRIFIPRHIENRQLRVLIACDGEVIDGPSEQDHVGEAAHPEVTRVYKKSSTPLLAGDCEAIAELRSQTDYFVSRARFAVMTPEAQ